MALLALLRTSPLRLRIVGSLSLLALTSPAVLAELARLARRWSPLRLQPVVRLWLVATDSCFALLNDNVLKISIVR